MPHKCDYCGEVVPCRKEKSIRGKYFGNFGPKGVSLYFFYNYICEKCDKAENILRKKYKEKVEKEDKIKINRWIKQRDKILKEAEGK